MVRSRRGGGEKPLHWVGSSKRDLLSFPELVVAVSRGICGSLQEGDLCPACLPEEVAIRNPHGANRCGADRTPAPAGGRGLRGSLWQGRRLRWSGEAAMYLPTSATPMQRS